MSMEAHHGLALIEEARAALDGVHRAALAADAGGLRRGLTMAGAALDSALKTELATEAAQAATEVRDMLASAAADLDGGKLVEMELLVEAARTKLAPV